jgi:hypothetical protein
MERDDIAIERHLADALRRLNDAAAVPPVDEAREAELMAAFDAAHATAVPRRRRDYWHLAAFAAAAAVLIAAGIAPALSGRRARPHEPFPASAVVSGGAPAVGAQPAAPHDPGLEPPSDFVIVPGAAGLPPMESGTLVRIDVPVAMLPSYGVTPPSGRGAIVTADFVVAQDGLPRAVRVVAP